MHRFARLRCCPLCRTEAYQKRQVHDGREAHRQRCAAKIQATVRAYLARKWYRQLRRRLPPQNPCLTRKWAAEQLQVSFRQLIVICVPSNQLAELTCLSAVCTRTVCVGQHQKLSSAMSGAICTPSTGPLASAHDDHPTQIVPYRLKGAHEHA